jgi:hypothetical protein
MIGGVKAETGGPSMLRIRGGGSSELAGALKVSFGGESSRKPKCPFGQRPRGRCLERRLDRISFAIRNIGRRIRRLTFFARVPSPVESD